MLLLVTNSADLTADWLVAELQARDARFVRFNTEEYPAGVPLEWSRDRAALYLDGQLVLADQVGVVWWRRPVAAAIEAGRSPAEAEWAVGEAMAALEGFWTAVAGRWVNRPLDNLAADCKPEQLRRAARLGFAVPDTMITNRASALRGFAERHQRIICKALREGHVPTPEGPRHFYTSSLTRDQLEDLSDFGPEPYQFQALVDKAYDVRVTVIGDAAYACRIDSQGDPQAAVDWRRADVERLPHHVHRLPSELTRRCVRLAHSYGLRFAAVDLAGLPDGSYAFFELNPNGQWAWVEQLTGLPLRARLADELLTGAA